MPQCPTCERSFTARSSLNRHVDTKHQPKPYLGEKSQRRAFQCWSCEKSFSRSDALSRHSLSHLRINKHNHKPACPICAVSICRSDHLKKHRRKCLAKLFADPHKLALLRSSTDSSSYWPNAQVQELTASIAQPLSPQASQFSRIETNFRFKNLNPPGREKILEVICGEISDAISHPNLDYLNRLLDQAAELGSSINKLEIVEHPSGYYAPIYERVKSVLHIACWKGNAEIVRCLLDRGADTEATLQQGPTPLFEAIERSHTEVVKILLTKGADVNARHDNPIYGATTLSSAIRRRAYDIAKLLLSSGAEIGTTVLSVDQDRNNLAAVQDFARHVQIVSVANGFRKGSNVYDFLMPAISRHDHRTASVLIDAGADLNVGEGCILMAAIRAGNLKMVRMLLEKGALPDLISAELQDELHETVLRRSSDSYYEREIASMLKQYGLNVLQDTTA